MAILRSQARSPDFEMGEPHIRSICQTLRVKPQENIKFILMNVTLYIYFMLSLSLSRSLCSALYRTTPISLEDAS